MADAKPTLVIGLGNPLMGDDGIGQIALERLAAETFAPPVELVDGGVWGLALLPDIERAGALLLLDAVHGDRKPGSLYVLSADQIPRFLGDKLSPHQVDVRELLALAQVRDALPARLQVVGVQPASVAFGGDLSPETAAAVDVLVNAACAVLAGWGHVRQTASEPPTSAAWCNLPVQPMGVNIRRQIMQISIHVKVLSKDGAAGHTAAVILDPKTQQVTHVVVKGSGSLSGEYLVPVDEIDKSTQHEITLHWSLAELAAAQRFDKVLAAGSPDGVQTDGALAGAAMFWPYAQADFLGVDPLDAGAAVATPAYFQVEQAPGDGIAVHTGAHVEAENGRVGTVDEFIIDRKSGAVTHIVLRHGHLWGKREIRVPVHEIDYIKDDTVHLKLDKAAVEDLPEQPKDA